MEGIKAIQTTIHHNNTSMLALNQKLGYITLENKEINKDGGILMNKILFQRLKLFMLIILVLSILTGCMAGDGSYNLQKPANFLSGIWHGWIAPISLIFSIGKNNIRIYEPINTGFWYDFGFYMAIISGFGGLSLSRKKKEKD